MKQTAAIYARVSTQHQEQEETIKSQVAAIEEYALREGYGLRKELYYLDEAVSGARLDRPGLDRLRDQAGEGVYQVVICLSPDRMARVYALQIILLEEFRQAGIEVRFVNQPAVSDDPHSQLLYGIQGIFAEYERAVIAERMRRGRLHRARQGGLVSSKTPYGYRYVARNGLAGGRWEIEPEEARVVEEVYDWYVQSERLSIAQITQRLNRSRARPRNGKEWRTSLVGNILRQRQYSGQAYYNRTQREYRELGQRRYNGHGKRTCPIHAPRPVEEWISIPAPKIIEAEIWERAQERLKTNQKFATRNNHQNHYLLRGLLVCAVCGHTLTGRTDQDKSAYGCCYGGKHCPVDLPRHTCAIAGDQIESLVWNAVVELVRNPKLISQAWTAQNDPQALKTETGEKERLEKRLGQLERQQDRLLDLFQEEQLDKAAYLERKRRLEEERQILQKRLQLIEGECKSEQVKQQVIDDFDQYCQRIQSSLANPSPKLKQEVIRLLIDHVVVGQNQIVIKHIVPSEDDCRLRPLHQAAKSQ